MELWRLTRLFCLLMCVFVYHRLAARCKALQASELFQKVRKYFVAFCV